MRASVASFTSSGVAITPKADSERTSAVASRRSTSEASSHGVICAGARACRRSGQFAQGEKWDGRQMKKNVDKNNKKDHKNEFLRRGILAWMGDKIKKIGNPDCNFSSYKNLWNETTFGMVSLFLLPEAIPAAAPAPTAAQRARNRRPRRRGPAPICCRQSR